MQADELIDVLAAALESRKAGNEDDYPSRAFEATLESVIKPVVRDAVQKAMEEFFRSDSFRQAVLAAIPPGNQ